MVRKLHFPTKRKWEYLENDRVTLNCYGIPIEFQEAFLRIVVESKCYYQRLFGRHVIDYVDVTVRKSAGLPHRLWTNGADRVQLTLSRKSQLEPATKSGVRNLHGFPHELAHIVMYRSLINLHCLKCGWGEGWAIYVASFLAVPHLYRKFGPTLWPYEHDFEKSDGPFAYFRKFEHDLENVRKWPAPLRVVCRLHFLEQELGRSDCVKFFRELLRHRIRADQFVSRVDSVMNELGISDLCGRQNRGRRKA